MRLGKIQYKKIPLDEVVELAISQDCKALEELIRRQQKNVFATFTYLSKKMIMFMTLRKRL